MKTSPVLGQLYQPFFNHLFYCHAKFPDKEDRPKALEYVRSFLKHVQGKHSWKKVNTTKEGGDIIEALSE